MLFSLLKQGHIHTVNDFLKNGTNKVQDVAVI